MTRHPDADLMRLADGVLPAAEAAGVSVHLESCDRCRGVLAELEDGVELARGLHVSRLPARRAEAIRRTLEEAPIGVTRPRGRRIGVWAAAVAVVVGSLGFFFATRPVLAFRPGLAEPLPFEELALRAHRALLSGAPALDVESSSVPDIRAFLGERGLHLGLATQKGGEPRIEIEGARLLPGHGAPVGAVSYKVDGRDVTLLVTHAAEVPQAPRWGPFGKRISVRTVGRLSLLTWSNSGNAYTLVSDLPGHGETACFICHTDPGRRTLIENAARADAGDWR